MKRRMYAALLLAIMGALILTGIAQAAEQGQREPPSVGDVVTQRERESIRHKILRLRGQVQLVIPGRSIFIIQTRGEDRVSIKVIDRTRFHSPDGAVQGIRDLERGMLVQVRGIRSGEDFEGDIIALEVSAAAREDIVSARGRIHRVDISAERFVLETADGTRLTVLTGERTRFFSPGGEVDSIADLEAGMVAGVLGAAREDGTVLALRVAVGRRDEIRDHLVRSAGEITRVLPGQSTFWLLSRDGQLLKLQVRERTQFRSADGSIQDIHDLEMGMRARVAAYETEGGELIALRVWVRRERDAPTRDRSSLDTLPETRPSSRSPADVSITSP